MRYFINENELFTSKANTLKVLYNNLSFSHIDDLHILTYKDFINNKSSAVNVIQKIFYHQNIIVRSSNISEDKISDSKAGKYKTIENINSQDENIVKTSIEQVFDSYKIPNKNDQVFIQRQIANTEIKIAGVAYTHQLVSGKPYYIINFDVTTNGITSGKTGKAVCISREWNDAKIEKEWELLLHSIKELEEITKNMSLDIEFAITKENKIKIFQVRPIMKTLTQSNKLLERLSSENEKMKKNIMETKKYFSDMAFWNPSEIIGDNPFPLDYSIYAKLVTDEAWNVGIRDLGFGYSDNKLMIKIGNKPYIDLKESFFALTPEEIPHSIIVKLNNYYYNKIKNNPSLHDKIEFQVVLNTFFFGINNLISCELKEILSEVERKQLSFALKSNLLKNISNYDSTVNKDHIAILAYLDFILTRKYTSIDDCLLFIKDLVDVLKNNVVPIFSRHARIAFMAKILLDSLADQNYISAQEKSIFYSSLSTITSEFLKDFSKMSYEDFLVKYGHLRSGTYNIRVDTYKDNLYKPSEFYEASNIEIEFIYDSIDKALKDEDIDIDAKIIIDFIRKAINLREKIKFHYSKGVSTLLDAILFIGKKLKISRNELSYLEIDDILLLNINDKISIQNSLQKKKNDYNINSQLILPNVIFDDTDLRYFNILEGRPNFITNEVALTELIYLKESINVDCNEKIVLIENADPGYDWLFTYKIKGLITKYGGMGSHMAIRCAELNIPAALGCGTILFDRILAAKIVLLDCERKIINVEELR